MSCLGIEIAFGDYIVKPIYLVLGVLMFLALIFCLILLYGFLLVKKSLKDTYNSIKIERKRYYKK